MRPLRAIAPLALVAACAGSAESTPPPPPQPPPTPETSGDESADEPTAEDRMLHHFSLVAEARDAVIRGDVAGVHAPMQKLYDGDYGIEIPQDWMSSLNEMQTVAERGRDVTTLQEAGQVVAMVSLQCGECHRSFGRPKQIAEAQPYAAKGSGLHEAMARHKWAAEQMWLGITTPSHEAWIRGANAISETWTPIAAEEGEEPAPKDASIDELIQAIRARGPALREAQTGHARAEAYGQLIADCGGCHVAAGVHIPK